MSVYIHKAYISKNQCQGDHNYFQHEGYKKQEEQILNQKIQDDNTHLDKMQQTIEKQQQLINQLELQNSNYNQTIIKQEQQIQSLLNQLKQQEKFQQTLYQELVEENQKLRTTIKDNQANNQPVQLIQHQEAIIQTEQNEEVIQLDQSQQIETIFQNQQTQTDLIINNTIQSKETPQFTQPLKLDVKTIRIQPIYYYQN